MKLGEDYVLCIDPKGSGQDDWSVILNNDPWENVVVRYDQVEILEKGTRLSFKPVIQYCPEGVETESKEFEDYIAAVLNDVIRDLHEQGGMQYYSKATGERIDV